MNRKRVSLLLAIAVLVALLLAGAPRVMGSIAADAAKCRIQGSWVGSFAGGPWPTKLIIQETISPQDPAGKRLTYVMRLVNPDATFGMFPEADYISELVGEAVRTGPNTYDLSLIGYGAKTLVGDRNVIQYIWTVTGSMECLDGGRKTDSVHLAVYAADQDADSDGFPDEGEEPVFCVGPTTLSAAKRVR